MEGGREGTEDRGGEGRESGECVFIPSCLKCTTTYTMVNTLNKTINKQVIGVESAHSKLAIPESAGYRVQGTAAIPSHTKEGSLQEVRGLLDHNLKINRKFPRDHISFSSTNTQSPGLILRNVFRVFLPTKRFIG